MPSTIEVFPLDSTAFLLRITETLAGPGDEVAIDWSDPRGDGSVELPRKCRILTVRSHLGGTGIQPSQTVIKFGKIDGLSGTKAITPWGDADRPAAAGVISLVSDDAADVGTIYVAGKMSDGTWGGEEVTMAGLTPALTVGLYVDAFRGRYEGHGGGFPATPNVGTILGTIGAVQVLQIDPTEGGTLQAEIELADGEEAYLIAVELSSAKADEITGRIKVARPLEAPTVVETFRVYQSSLSMAWGDASRRRVGKFIAAGSRVYLEGTKESGTGDGDVSGTFTLEIYAAADGSAHTVEPQLYRVLDSGEYLAQLPEVQPDNPVIEALEYGVACYFGAEASIVHASRLEDTAEADNTVITEYLIEGGWI